MYNCLYTFSDASELDQYIFNNFTAIRNIVYGNRLDSKIQDLLHLLFPNDDFLRSELEGLALYIKDLVTFLDTCYKEAQKNGITEAVSYGSDLRNKYKANPNIKIPEPQEKKIKALIQ